MISILRIRNLKSPRIRVSIHNKDKFWPHSSKATVCLIDTLTNTAQVTLTTKFNESTVLLILPYTMIWFLIQVWLYYTYNSTVWFMLRTAPYKASLVYYSIIKWFNT